MVPDALVERIAARVAEEHPREAGGFLACRRRGPRLRAMRHVGLPNESSDPRRRFRTVVDERAPTPPRVFYHSHTSPASPSGLTRLDERNIPEPFALVVFAPRGEPTSYRAFKRGLLRWREMAAEREATDGEGRERLPRLG